jgi:hypothetical protein
MKKVAGLVAVVLLGGGFAWAQQVLTQGETLAEAARRVRAELARKDLSRVPLFTNDNLPKAGGAISVVGGASAAAPAEGGAAGAEQAAAGAQGDCDDNCWKARFSEQRGKIQTAQRELEILQREYNLARTQFYQDPNQAVREQYSGNTAGGQQLQALQQQISEKQAEIQKLQQELSNLENELRRAGGNPGLARGQ